MVDLIAKRWVLPKWLYLFFIYVRFNKMVSPRLKQLTLGQLAPSRTQMGSEAGKVVRNMDNLCQKSGLDWCGQPKIVDHDLTLWGSRLIAKLVYNYNNCRVYGTYNL